MENLPNTKKATKADDELRPLICELNPLTLSDGSSMLAQGATCVLASFMGPIEVKAQNLNIEKAHLEIIFRPKAGIPAVKDKIRENLIKETCELALLTGMYPRTTISIHVQEFDDRSGLEACSINAVCLALLVGGVPMQFTFAALHCIIDKENKLILDPEYTQAVGCLASFTFVFDSLNKDLLLVHTHGKFKVSQLNDAEMLCRAASDVVFEFYRTVMTKFYHKSLLYSNYSINKEIPSNIETEQDEQMTKQEKMDESETTS